MRRRPGDIVDLAGKVVGRHDGVLHFTVGQRKGLGLSGNQEPLFVIALDAANARVVVGPREALRTRTVMLREVNWLIDATKPFDCSVKVRSMRPPVAARVTPLARPQRAGRASGARRERGAGTGLRLLRARRHARAGRRLDRPCGGAAASRRMKRFTNVLVVGGSGMLAELSRRLCDHARSRFGSGAQ